LRADGFGGFMDVLPPGANGTANPLELGAFLTTDAIRTLDAWWPLWMEAQFEPVLGKRLFEGLVDAHKLDNEPNNGGAHLGSAYQDGWYGYAYKDIRTILARNVESSYGWRYCGAGSRRGCREVLLGSSLREALQVPASQLYGGDPQCESGNDVGFSAQMCFDAVLFRPTGGITQPLNHWSTAPPTSRRSRSSVIGRGRRAGACDNSISMSRLLSVSVPDELRDERAPLILIPQALLAELPAG
jgi:hypothetical protein